MYEKAFLPAAFSQTRASRLVPSVFERHAIERARDIKVKAEAGDATKTADAKRERMNNLLNVVFRAGPREKAASKKLDQVLELFGNSCADSITHTLSLLASFFSF